MNALISIHDVMPPALPQVDALLRQLPACEAANICLLIVPGCDWQSEHIRQLKNWQEQGYELAGHGWHHHTHCIRGVYHRLHSLLISRNVAEHLSLGETDIYALIERNFAWFTANGLQPPSLYVPPAWAMGRIRRDYLAQLPFRYYETLGGIFDSETGRFRRLPLAGFEARNRWQAWLLSFSNHLNAGLSSRASPLRIAIHPHDRTYLLNHTIDAWLNRVDRTVGYRELFADTRLQQFGETS